MTDLDVIDECVRVLNNVGMDIYADKLESLKSQLESDLNEYKKIKKVFTECDLITESGNIFIPDLKGLKEGHMVVVDREEYEELKSKLAESNSMCPICQGRGFVPEGFYRTTSGSWSSTSTLTEICRTCKGSGVYESQHTNLVKAIQDLNLNEVLQNLKDKEKWFDEVDKELEAYKIHSGISNVIQERMNDYRRFKNMFTALSAYVEKLQNLLESTKQPSEK